MGSNFFRLVSSRRLVLNRQNVTVWGFTFVRIPRKKLHEYEMVINQEFTRLAQHKQSVVLDFSRVRYIDYSFVIMMLELARVLLPDCGLAVCNLPNHLKSFFARIQLEKTKKIQVAQNIQKAVNLLRRVK